MFIKFLKFGKILWVYMILFSSIAKSQSGIDSVAYHPDFKFNDGIFMDYNDFKMNNAVPFEHIITSYNPQSPDFLTQLISEPECKYYQDGQKKTVSTKTIWGYSKNGVVHIQYSKAFYRIPLLGQISFFIANVEVVRSNGYTGNPYQNSVYYPYEGTYTSTELRKFIFDFSTGMVFEYSIENLTRFMSADQALYQEFTSLKKRKQKELDFLYLRKFNDKHPIYFPIL